MGDFHDDRFSPGAANRTPGVTPSRGYEEPPQVARPSGYGQRNSPNRSYQHSDQHSDQQSFHQLRLVEKPEPKATDHRSNSKSPVAGKDRWNPSGDKKWKRVQGDVYAGEANGGREGSTKKVPATTTSGQPVYQAKYGQTTVYGWRSSDGVANFSDQKPVMKVETKHEQPKGGSGWGDK